jgi:hypothetical protein
MRGCAMYELVRVGHDELVGGEYYSSSIILALYSPYLGLAILSGMRFDPRVDEKGEEPDVDCDNEKAS